MEQAHKPGRATDAAVHRALWPEHKVKPGYDGYVDREIVSWYRAGGGLWTEVPHYTTSLMAWDGVGDDRGWYWRDVQYRFADEDRVQSEFWRSGHGHERTQVVLVADHDNNRFQAQAMARALCVLAWAERSGE